MLVAGIFFVGGKAVRGLSDQGVAVTQRATEEARLDPAEFRQGLEELESLVYAANPRQFDHGAAIFRAASQVSNAIMQREGGMLVQARNQQYGLEVLSFGHRQAAMDDIGYAAFDFSTAQSDWESVRSDVFQDAEWFRESLRQAATGGTQIGRSRSMDPSTVRMLRDLAAGLENAARFGRQQAMRVGELRGDPRSADSRRTREAWNTFRQSMNSSLSAAVAGLPSEGRWLSMDAQSAHQYLDQAVDRMMTLARTSTVPTRSSRAAAFDSAERNIQQAKTLLAQIQQ